MKTNASISKVGKEISKVWEHSELDAVKDYKNPKAKAIDAVWACKGGNPVHRTY